VPHIEKSALVPYADQAMFDLVKDIDRYVEFLPWCGGSEVLSEQGYEVCGRLVVERMGVKQAFITCNQLQAPQRIDLKLKEGPFKSLSGTWRFIALREDACKVCLNLDFTFSNRLMDAAFGKVFEQIANTMVESFCQRAKQVYG
jgi:ribosome-associated toxin RatA of RatAB toxin-antitoxin module